MLRREEDGGSHTVPAVRSGCREEGGFFFSLHIGPVLDSDPM